MAQRPSLALLALLNRRLLNFSHARIDERTALARQACDLLPTLEIPGRHHARHSFWVFPIIHDHPEALRKHLTTLGYDATCGGSSLCVIPPATPESPRALRAEQAYARLLYLPIYPGVTRGEIAGMAVGIEGFEPTNQDSESPATHTAPDSELVGKS